MAKIQKHTELEVYQKSFASSMEIFSLSQIFPKEETYSLTDQVRRSSRSVCSNIAEAWRRRVYQADFINKLNLAEAEAAETQVWLQFAVECNYLESVKGRQLYRDYDEIIGKLVNMRNNPDVWILKR